LVVVVAVAVLPRAVLFTVVVVAVVLDGKIIYQSRPEAVIQ
jgi:hypothetical protein